MITRLALCALTAGVMLVQGLHDLPQFSPAWLLVPALLGGLHASSTVQALGALLLGAALSLASGQRGLEARLDPGAEGDALELEGRVAAPPRTRGVALRLVVAVERLGRGEAGRPRRVQLAWYGAAPEIAAGARCRLYVRLQRPHGARNPGGFDFERWAFAQRIDAVGYVVTHPANQCRAPGRRGAVDRVRQRLAAAISHAVPAPATAGVLRALAVGDRAEMSDAQWRLLQDSGAAHLVSISGLHIAMVAMLGFGVARVAWSGVPALLRRVPAAHAAGACAVLAAALYASLAGFTVPTQRTLFMIALALLAKLHGRALLDVDTYLLVLAIVLLVDPLACLTASFWWSFGAVGALLLFAAGARRQGRGWRWGGVHFGLAVALVPLLGFSLQSVPLASPLANLIAVPWVTLVIVPLVLVGGLAWLLGGLAWLLGGLAWLLGGPGAAACWRLAGAQWELLNRLLEGLVAVLPPLALPTRPSLVAALLAAAGVALWCVPVLASRRWLAALLVLQLWRPAGALPAGHFRLDVLDVGQGLAAVIATRHHVLVYDAGPRWPGGGDAGAAVVAPFLRGQGWHRIDALLVSHPDADHAGGAASLEDAFDPAAVWVSPTQDDMPHAAVCRAGMRWLWDGVEFAILHPGPEPVGRDNDASCVLRVSAPGGRVLLAGDIEAAGERQLLGRGADLAADVLVAPHHGSATSSSAAFLAAVAPRHAVFSAGHRNRFGHPAPAVWRAYGDRGIVRWSTAEAGALSFAIGAQLSGPRSHRAATHRYYHWEPPWRGARP